MCTFGLYSIFNIHEKLNKNNHFYKIVKKKQEKTVANVSVLF